MRNLLNTLPKYTLTIAIWAIAAVLLRPLAPWLFWFTSFALPITVIITREKSYLTSANGRKVIGLCVILLFAHVVWAIVRSQSYNAALPGTFWKDDNNYYTEASAIALAWKDHFYPDIWRKGSLPYLGTLHTGYHRPLALLFIIFKPTTLVALLFNAVCAATFPLLMALSARYLWSIPAPRSPIKRSLLTNDIGLIAALLAALHPNQFYWSAYMMKDTYVAFVFLSVLTLVLGAYRNKSVPMTIAACLVLPYFFTIRIYAAFSIVLGTALVPVLNLTKKAVLQIVAAIGILTVLVCFYTSTGSHLFNQVKDSIAALAPHSAGGSLDIIKQMLAGIPRLFLAPYAWLSLDKPTPMYGLYPGMWYLYIVGYPLFFAGFAAVLKHNVKLAVIPIAAFGFASLLFLVASYGGNAPRQRYYLEYVVLLFAVYGLYYPSKYWMAGVVIAEIAFATGQVLALR